MKLSFAAIVLFSFLSFSITAQDTIFHYLDKYESIIPEKNNAMYFSKAITEGEKYLVRIFRMSGQTLYSEGFYDQISPSFRKDGPFQSYFTNGQPESEGTYREGVKEGIWKTFYENGQLEMEMDYRKSGAYYIGWFDKAGQPLLVDGTGIAETGRAEDGKTVRYADVENRQLVSSFSVIDGDTVYVIVQETAEYPGGMPRLYQTIGSTIKYPKAAVKQNISGKVFVQFTIDKTGKISNKKVLKGIGGGCDEEAMRVFDMTGDWRPGRVRGKAVNQTMVLPVAFKLN
jgi:TonB family protein